MPASKHRLDRYLSIKTNIPKKNIRLVLAQQRVTVNGSIATDTQTIVNRFSTITLDGKILQQRTPIYLMMHKARGVVSATKDDKHQTVLDVISKHNNLDITDNEINGLHIVGRLDLHSSGLLLLTNDSTWSKRLMSPDQKIEKIYEVSVQNPISEDCIKAFSDGIYFSYEDITTQAATLEKIDECSARISLTEGKYHQIKRMFGRFRNPVLKLHRIKIGHLSLDPSLNPGQCRHLYKAELDNCLHPSLS